MTPEENQPPTPPNPLAPPPPTPPAQDGTGLQPNVAAGLACIFLLLGGIIFLVLEKKDKYVRFYAMQSVFLGGLNFAFYIFVRIAGFILAQIPVIGKIVLLLLGLLSAVVGLGVLVLWVILIIKAFSGKEWEIPYLGALARKQLESGKFGAA
jgi:uncharacterized membrane protein